MSSTPSTDNVMRLLKLLCISALLFGQARIPGPGGGVPAAPGPMPTINFVPETMTGNSTPSPFVASASSIFSGTFDAFRAFDGDAGTGRYWLGTGSGVDQLQIDTGSGNSHLLNNYSIQVNTIPEPTRAPKDWTVDGSTNGSTWITLDTRTNESSWGSGEIRNYHCTGVTTPYRYFRLSVTANNGDATYTQVASLFLLELTGTNDLAPHTMISAFQPYPYTASASSESSSALAAYKAFEGTVGFAGYWDGTGSGVDSIKLDSGGVDSYFISSYSIQVGTISGSTSRAPKDWVFAGSTNDSTWTTLDSRTNQTAWSASETRNYVCAGVSTAFRYFRLSVSANNGDATNTEVAEFYLFVR